MRDKELAGLGGRPFTARDQAHPLPRTVPMQEHTLWVTLTSECLNRTGVTKVARLLHPVIPPSLAFICHKNLFSLGRPRRGQAEAGETGASLLYLPPPPASSSWFPGRLGFLSGPRARQPGTSTHPTGAPSAPAGPLSVAPLWLREVGRKGGVGVPWGCRGPARVLRARCHAILTGGGEAEVERAQTARSTTH